MQILGAHELDFSQCYPQEALDETNVLFDLNYFKYCFLKATGLEFNEVQLQEDFERFKADLLKDDDNTFMYRDFQARNVMLRDGEPYFIDYQGGRRGPIYYDVASFIWQARSRYPEELRQEMIRTYLRALRGFTQVDEAHFHERLRLFVLFRTLQVLGAYGFRGYFEKKPHFIASVPYALGNLRRLLRTPFKDYPYLNALLAKLASMPQFNETAQDKRLEVHIYSFAYKKGIPADNTGNGGGYVFDCRSVNNPGKYEHYRQRGPDLPRQRVQTGRRPCQALHRTEVHPPPGLLRMHRRPAPVGLLRRTPGQAPFRQVRRQDHGDPPGTGHRKDPLTR